MSAIPDPILHPVDIVYGVYRLQGPAFQGDDRWWIQRLVESETGWMVHNDVYLDHPTRRYVTIDVELSDEWGWLYLNLRDDRGLLLAAEVEGPELVVERAGSVERLPFDDRTELAFLSPFMTSLTLRRHPLGVGERYTCRTIVFDPHSFAPHLVDLRYERGPDTTLTLEGETLDVQQVRCQDLTTGQHTGLLVRPDGLVVQAGDEARLTFDETASRGRGRLPPLGEGGREA